MLSKTAKIPKFTAFQATKIHYMKKIIRWGGQMFVLAALVGKSKVRTISFVSHLSSENKRKNPQ